MYYKEVLLEVYHRYFLVNLLEAQALFLFANIFAVLFINFKETLIRQLQRAGGRIPTEYVTRAPAHWGGAFFYHVDLKDPSKVLPKPCLDGFGGICKNIDEGSGGIKALEEQRIWRQKTASS